MKNKNTIFTVIIAVLIIGFLAFKFLPNLLNSNDFDDLIIYKNNAMVHLSDDDKNKIINYLKKESFQKVENATQSIDRIYVIKYDNVEISFDNNSNCYYMNNNTLENYYSNISDGLRQYIINVTD